MKPHKILLFILVALCLCFVYGCAGMWHALNVSTLDDLDGSRTDQHAVDVKQSQAVEDDRANPTQAPTVVATTRAAIAKADVDYRGRTPPPTPGGGPDWNVLIPATLAGIATILGATAHIKSNANAKSLAETDKWVETKADKA
jgi:hypothetical protein